MKKLLALLLVVTMLVGMMSCLAGCKEKEEKVTKGELLNMLCDAFGMYSYSSDQPHTDTVKEDNKYFTCVQAAYEWEIINDKNINTEDAVDKDFLSSVLVKSVGFTDVNDMSTEEITQYAVDNNYVDFSYRGRTDGMRYVTYDEVTNSLNKSVKMWGEKKYSTPVEKVTYNEDTHQLTKDVEGVIANMDGTVSVPSDMIDDVKVGDTYIATDPATNSPKLYKVKETTTVGDSVVIVPEEETPALEEAIQDLDTSGSIEPNLTTCPITDGLGNVINSETASVPQSGMDAVTATPLMHKVGDAQVEELAKGTFALNFEVSGVKISGSVSSNKISFKAKGELYTNKSKTFKVSVDKSYDIKDISFDYDYKFGLLGLKYAYAKLNYTTVDTTKVGAKFEKTWGDGDDPWELAKFPIKNQDLQKKINDSVYKGLSDLQGKAGKSIKICEVPVYTNGVVSFNIVVKLKFSISGEVQLVVTTDNAKGVEYKNGNLRYIKEEKKDTDIKVSAKAELTLYIGAAFKAVGVNIIGFGIEGGVGAKGSVIIHVVDQERHLLTEVKTEVALSAADGKLSSMVGLSLSADAGGTITLNPEICFDYKVYGILKFTVDDDSVIGKIFKGTEIEIFGEDNAAFLSGHIEGGKDVEKCTREFKIDDDEEEKKDEENQDQLQDGSDTENGQDGSDSNGVADDEDDQMMSSGYLDVDTYFINLSVGENYNLQIEKFPNGYTLSDIVFKSSDNAIVTVNSSGKITACASGTAVVYVETKDGKYKQECSILVINPADQVTFVPLSYWFNMSKDVVYDI